MFSSTHRCRCTIELVSCDLSSGQIQSNNATFYSGTVKCFALTPQRRDLSSSRGNYWHIYHSPGVPLTISQLAVPYLCVPHHSSLHRWKKTDSISVSWFALCTSLLVELKSMVQMDTGSQFWPETLVTDCSLTHWLQGGTTTCQSLRESYWWFRAAVRDFKEIGLAIGSFFKFRFTWSLYQWTAHAWRNNTACCNSERASFGINCVWRINLSAEC